MENIKWDLKSKIGVGHKSLFVNFISTSISAFQKKNVRIEEDIS
jgi:hypothetical protein